MHSNTRWHQVNLMREPQPPAVREHRSRAIGNRKAKRDRAAVDERCCAVRPCANLLARGSLMTLVRDVFEAAVCEVCMYIGSTRGIAANHHARRQLATSKTTHWLARSSPNQHDHITIS